MYYIKNKHSYNIIFPDTLVFWLILNNLTLGLCCGDPSPISLLLQLVDTGCYSYPCLVRNTLSSDSTACVTTPPMTSTHTCSETSDKGEDKPPKLKVPFIKSFLKEEVPLYICGCSPALAIIFTAFSFMT